MSRFEEEPKTCTECNRLLVGYCIYGWKEDGFGLIFYELYCNKEGCDRYKLKSIYFGKKEFLRLFLK